MSAERINDYSLKVFTAISFILVKHKCFMKDIDMNTGIFIIDGDSQQSIKNCEEDIYEYVYSNNHGGVM